MVKRMEVCRVFKWRKGSRSCKVKAPAGASMMRTLLNSRLHGQCSRYMAGNIKAIYDPEGPQQKRRANDMNPLPSQNTIMERAPPVI